MATMATPTMRIGVVATSYPRWPGDAAGSFVDGHVRYLRGCGAEVEVVAAGHGLPAPDGLFFDGGAPEAIESALSAAQPLALVRALGFSARMVATVARRARGWDAIAAHWLVPAAAAAALAPRRVPMLAIAHGGDVHLLARMRLLAPVMALLVARDARLVFVSDELRRRAVETLPRWLGERVVARSMVQPMGVDDARTAAIVDKRAAAAAAAAAAIVVLARLVPVKGVETAIAAMFHLPASARLVIAGDGPERAALAALAAPLGDRVQFLGWIDGDARDALLASADVVVVPSAPVGANARSEGMPMAALEALAAGVPLVASATGGLRELARVGARLVPPRDPRALAHSVECVLRHGLAHARPARNDRGQTQHPGQPIQHTGAAIRMQFGWNRVGEVLDRHWRREHGYAPAPFGAQASEPHWSSRPADSGKSVSYSG
jgi:glycosyltransferase involved in cell wall biosynthesis